MSGSDSPKDKVPPAGGKENPPPSAPLLRDVKTFVPDINTKPERSSIGPLIDNSNKKG